MGLFGTSSPFDPLLDKATNEQSTQEDWSLILSICDKARASSKNGKDCLASINKKLGNRVPRVVIQALVVLDACVSNSGREFQKLVSSQEFINELRPLVMRHDLVGEKTKGLIKKWSKEFENDPELSLIVSFYHYLRSAGQHFPTEEEGKKSKVNTNPDAVDSQREADEIAIAIQRSLNEEKAKEVKKEPEVPSLYYSTLQTSPTSPGKRVKALYDFEAAEDNELTFKTGDLINLIEESDPNWWEGELNGKTGLFPSNFVEPVKSGSPDLALSNGIPDDKKEEDKRVVVKVDPVLLDSTLVAVESADPTQPSDSPEMLNNENICKKMGGIIDAKLSEMDTEQIELTQLNQKLLQCLQLYDSLMQQEQFNAFNMHQMQHQLPSIQNPMPNMYAPPISQVQAPMYSQYHQDQQVQGQPQLHHTQPQQMDQSQMHQPQMQQPIHQGQHVAGQIHQTQPGPAISGQQQLHQSQIDPHQMPPSTPLQHGTYEPTAPPPTPPVSAQQYL